MAVIDAVVYVDGKRVAEGLSPEDALAQAREKKGTVWIGLNSPDADEIARIGGLFGLHPLVIEESQRDHTRAALERFGDQLFIVLQPAHYIDASETVETAEIDLLVGPDYIVTVHSDDAVDLAGTRAYIERHDEILSRGPIAVVWAVFEMVVRGYAPVLAGVENDIDEIETALFSREKGVSQRIFALQREVIDLHHATAPLPDMLTRMQQIVTEATGRKEAPAFREAYDRAQVVIDRVLGFKHTLDSALQVDATLSEQRTNEDMKRMTEFGLQQNDQVKKISSWAAILFAPTLVGTVYGMNFDDMPELSWQFGYPMALGLMVVTSVTLYVVFKKRGWL